MGGRKLVIVGDSAFAEIAYEYFSVDTDYEVVAFSVEAAFLRQDSFHGLPVVAFEDLPQKFAPESHDVFVAITYTQLNRLRKRLSLSAKQRGYQLASYVSPRAFVWRNVEIGEHCFIFEDNTVQPFVKLGDNVVLWSGNHIGHHSVIGDNCFVSSHVVISGYCEIGNSTFLGVNSTLSNNVKVEKDNWIGPSVLISKNTQPSAVYSLAEVEPSRVSSLRLFKVKE